ncbi:MAG TPA: methyltransferase domain-containing protein [Rhodospirillales bacterium]|nr:methyltransferase domain-containing protein [Rhodospirillales bacterium]
MKPRRSLVDDESVSEDALMGGRIVFFQPKVGYRAAIDPVILAACVAARPGDRVLDVGCGAGAAALCLIHRVPGADVTGLEIAPDLAALARKNARANGFEEGFKVMEGDLLDPPRPCEPASFNHVMANPPYQELKKGHPPPDPGKSRANVEGEARLADWIDFCLSRTRPKGAVTLIHRADRLGEILAAVQGRLGGLVVFPLWPGPMGSDKAAKRVVVTGRKGLSSPFTLAPGLVLHGPEGGFTAEADAVLRHGEALDFPSLNRRGGALAHGAGVVPLTTP